MSCIADLVMASSDSLAEEFNLNPYYARGIKKKPQPLIYIVWPAVHVNPARKWSFSRTLFKLKESLKHNSFLFPCERETLSKRSFFRNDLVTIIMTISLYPKFPQTNSKTTADCCVFKSLGVVQTVNV